MAEMKTYRALSALYVDERYIAADEVFTTAAVKGEQWVEIVSDDAPAKRGPKPRPVEDD